MAAQIIPMASRARLVRRRRKVAQMIADACAVLLPILAWCGAALLAVEW